MLNNANTKEKLLDKINNQWIRHSFLISLAIWFSENPNFINNKNKVLISKIINNELERKGENFLILLSQWLNHNYGFSFLNRKLNIAFESQPPNAEQIRIRQALSNQQLLFNKNINFKRHQDLKDIEILFDMAFLNFQLPVNKKIEIYGQGRYGLVFESFKNIVKNVEKDLQKEFFLKVLKCEEEGIRWALAAISPDFYKNDPEFHDKVICELLRDNNIWVFREAIDALNKIPGVIKSKYAKKYVNKIVKRLYEMNERGDPSREDLKYPFVKLVSKDHRFTKSFDIIPAERPRR